MGADGCAGREAGVGSWITQQWVPSLGARVVPGSEVALTALTSQTTW